MALVLPSTVENPTAGQPATAAWGDAVNDAFAYLGTNKPRARVYNSANLAVAHNTATILTLNSERYDVGSCHSTATNTSRLTVPTGEGGVYLIGGSILWASNGTGTRYLQILLNGTTVIANNQINAAGTAEAIAQTVSTDYALAAADYVELRAYQFSGGSLNVTATGNYSPEFWFRWVAT